MSQSLLPAQQANDAFLKLHRHLLKESYRGYEFDDFLSSPLLRAVSRRNLLLQRVFVQVGELLPINVRALLGIRKLESAKARGFFARGYLFYHLWNGDAKWLGHANECLEWLLRNPSEGFRGLSWGNAFDFASRGGYMPAGLPTVVWTSHIAEAFELAYQITKKEEFLAALQKAAEFVLFSLPRNEDPTGCCIGYTPVTSQGALIHNSSLLGAATLLRSWRYFGGDLAAATAQGAYRWSLAQMNQDGSWYYGVGQRWNWIDNFHTAYNIECLLLGHEIGGEEIVPWRSLELSVKFWLNNFFLADGIPKYYPDQAYPLDIQCAAQAIETASKLRIRFPEAGRVADAVLQWTLDNMQKKNGAFRYQKRQLWTNNLESIHWGQSTMLAALGGYLRYAKEAGVAASAKAEERVTRPFLISAL